MSKDNIIYLENEQFFFSLLRSGLWDIPVDYKPQEPVNWNAIYKMAVMQTVVPLIADGIDHYQGQKPEGAVLKAFIKEVFHTERRNVQINECIEKIFRLFKENDIKAYLIKGQGVAQTYINPLHRQSGDIDLLLLGDNYQKAKELLIPLCHNIENEIVDNLHIAMTMEDVEIELHGTIKTNADLFLDSRADKWMHDIMGLPAPEWKINDCEIILAPYNFDAIYIFLHFFYHYLYRGVGLRQICDWVRFLHCYSRNIDKERIISDLNFLKKEKGWSQFASFVVDKLGCPIIDIPLYKGETTSIRKVTDFMMEGGNFGKYSLNKKRNEALIIHKMHSFLILIRVFFKHFLIFPRDVLDFSIGSISYAIVRNLKMLFKKNKH